MGKWVVLTTTSELSLLFILTRLTIHERLIFKKIYFGIRSASFLKQGTRYFFDYLHESIRNLAMIDYLDS